MSSLDESVRRLFSPIYTGAERDGDSTVCPRCQHLPDLPMQRVEVLMGEIVLVRRVHHPSGDSPHILRDFFTGLMNERGEG